MVSSVQTDEVERVRTWPDGDEGRQFPSPSEALHEFIEWGIGQDVPVVGQEDVIVDRQEKLTTFFDALDDHDDVQELYSNVQ